MADSVLIKLEGVDALVRALRDAPQKIRVKAVRRALTLAGRVIRDAAKAEAPMLGDAERLRFGPVRPRRFKRKATATRKPGTVRRAISVRPSKFARQGGDEGVFIGVRPLRGSAQIKRYGKASARNPNDPFYWRFLEFGTRKMGKRPFLGPAARSEGDNAIATFMREAVPAIQKLNQKGA